MGRHTPKDSLLESLDSESVSPEKIKKLLMPVSSRGVQVSGTKRGPKSPKFTPKIGLLRWIFDIHLPDTLRPSKRVVS